MNPKLDKFIKSKEANKSILFTQKDEIFELRRLGYSFESICQYLKTVNIDTTKQNLSQWYKRQNIDNSTTKNNTNDESVLSKKKQEQYSSTNTFSEKESITKLLQSSNQKFNFDDLMDKNK